MTGHIGLLTRPFHIKVQDLRLGSHQGGRHKEAIGLKSMTFVSHRLQGHTLTNKEGMSLNLSYMKSRQPPFPSLIVFDVFVAFTASHLAQS